jgi:hypothetical protein
MLNYQFLTYQFLSNKQRNKVELKGWNYNWLKKKKKEWPFQIRNGTELILDTYEILKLG